MTIDTGTCANDRERVVFDFLHSMGPTAADVRAAFAGRGRRADRSGLVTTGVRPSAARMAEGREAGTAP